MSFEDIEIYQGKKASDLFRDIVKNSEEKKQQIDLLISELKGLIKNANDAIMLVPLLRDYLEVGIKNDAELNKLASVIQRLITTKSEESGGGGLGLTDEEREELLKEVNQIATTDSKKIETEIKSVEKKKKITLNIGDE